MLCHSYYPVERVRDIAIIKVVMTTVTRVTCAGVPYSGKLSREKTFADQ